MDDALKKLDESYRDLLKFRNFALHSRRPVRTGPITKEEALNWAIDVSMMRSVDDFLIHPLIKGIPVRS